MGLHQRHVNTVHHNKPGNIVNRRGVTTIHDRLINIVLTGNEGNQMGRSIARKLTLWLREFALLHARLDSTVELGIEGALRRDIDPVVVLNIFLEGLATVVAKRLESLGPKAEAASEIRKQRIG